MAQKITKRDRKGKILATDKSERTYEEMQWNNYNEIAKTPKERKVIFEAYITHIKDWFSKECFPLCSHQTIHRYTTIYPNEFNIKKIEQAEREWMMFWEKMLTWCAIWKMNWKASWVATIFALKNKYPSKYKDKHEIEMGENTSKFLFWLPKSPFMDWTLKRNKKDLKNDK